MPAPRTVPASHSPARAAGRGPSVMVSAGKSSSMRSAANAAPSGPLLVSKVIGVVPSITLWARRAWAAARVACPHRSISTRGENQRSPNVPGSVGGGDERGLGDAQLGGEGLHGRDGEGLLEETDPRRISCERPVCEGINPGERDGHSALMLVVAVSGSDGRGRGVRPVSPRRRVGPAPLPTPRCACRKPSGRGCVPRPDRRGRRRPNWGWPPHRSVRAGRGRTRAH